MAGALSVRHSRSLICRARSNGLIGLIAEFSHRIGLPICCLRGGADAAQDRHRETLRAQRVGEVGIEPRHEIAPGSPRRPENLANFREGWSADQPAELQDHREAEDKGSGDAETARGEWTVRLLGPGVVHLPGGDLREGHWPARKRISVLQANAVTMRVLHVALISAENPVATGCCCASARSLAQQISSPAQICACWLGGRSTGLASPSRALHDCPARPASRGLSRVESVEIPRYQWDGRAVRRPVFSSHGLNREDIISAGLAEWRLAGEPRQSRPAVLILVASCPYCPWEPIPFRSLRDRTKRQDWPAAAGPGSTDLRYSA